MSYPTSVLKAKSRIGTAARYIGADSPEVHAAHLEFAALRAAHDLGTIRAQHGAFTDEQIAVVVAAMKGEVSK